MAKASKKSKILTLLIGLSLSTFAQYNDACLWMGITLEKKLPRKTYFLLAPQLRLDNNYSDTDKLFADIGFGIKPVKNLEFELMYRWVSARNKTRSFEMQHRFYADLSYRIKTEKWVITNRVRYQNQYSDFYKSENWNIPSKYFRYRLTLKLFPERQLQFFAFGEAWYALNDQNDFKNLRYGVGADYDINKHHSIGASYFIDQDINQKNPMMRFVMSFNYKYVF